MKWRLSQGCVLQQYMVIAEIILWQKIKKFILPCSILPKKGSIDDKMSIFPCKNPTPVGPHI